MHPEQRSVAEARRHHSGEHTEAELRYIAPENFGVPDMLGGMELRIERRNPHVDRYYEAPGAGPLLRQAGASLRVRVKNDGQVLATFKLKLPDAGKRSLRQETESPVSCPDCERCAAECVCGLCSTADNFTAMVNYASTPALSKARQLAGASSLVYLFTIENRRVDYHYSSADSHVVLSLDQITYPDGSAESRVEVEHVTGNPERLDAIHSELKELYPGIRRVKRGKLSEGRRRLSTLLTA